LSYFNTEPPPATGQAHDAAQIGASRETMVMAGIDKPGASR